MNRRKWINKWIALLLALAMIFSSQAMEILADDLTLIIVNDGLTNSDENDNSEPEETTDGSSITVSFYKTKPTGEEETESSNLIGTVSFAAPNMNGAAAGNTKETETGTAETKSTEAENTETKSTETKSTGSENENNGDETTGGDSVGQPDEQEEITVKAFSEVLAQFLESEENAPYTAFSWSSDSGKLTGEELMTQNMDVWISPIPVNFYRKQPAAVTETEETEETGGSGTGTASEPAADEALIQTVEADYGTLISEASSKLDMQYRGLLWSDENGVLADGAAADKASVDVWLSPVTVRFYSTKEAAEAAESVVTTVNPGTAVDGETGETGNSGEPAANGDDSEDGASGTEGVLIAEYTADYGTTLSELIERVRTEYPDYEDTVWNLNGDHVLADNTKAQNVWPVSTDGIVTVTSADGTTTGYPTLKAAIAAAKSGDTVMVNKDLTGAAEIGQSGTIVVNKTLTIDLGGYTINAAGAAGILTFGLTGRNDSVTLKNGTLTGTQGDSGSPVRIGDNKKCSGTVNLEGLNITGNSTTGNGGGIFINVYSAIAGAAVINLKDSIVSNNSSGSTGGGIYVYGKSSSARVALNIENSTIANNVCNTTKKYSGNNGGGILIDNYANVTVTGSTITGNATAPEGTSNYGDGGGIYVNSANNTLSVSGSTISQNIGKAGGGLYVYNRDAKITLNGTNVIGNTAKGSGGGISTQAQTILDGTNVIGNTAMQGSGGGINGRIMTITGGEISNNTALGSSNVSAFGGGVYLTGTSTVTGGTVISGNTAVSGGGLYSSSSLTLDGVTVSNNAAAGGKYSYLDYVNKATGSVSYPGGSTAFGGGGGISVTASSSNTIKISNVIITGNQSQDSFAPGLLIKFSTANAYSKTTLSGVTVSGNASADSEVGVLLYTNDYKSALEEKTVKLLTLSDENAISDELLPAIQIAGASERFSVSKLEEEDAYYLVIDSSPAVYVNGTAKKNGLGTETDPCNSYEAAEKALIEKLEKNDQSGKDRTSPYIYVMGTLTVKEDTTWPTEDWGNRTAPTLIRYDNTTASKDMKGCLVKVSSGTLQLDKGIVLDGNKKALTAEESLINVEGGKLEIKNATLQNNVKYNNNSAIGGGAVYCKDGTVDMLGGTITGNSTQLYGGGIALYQGANMTLSGGIIEKNELTKQLDTAIGGGGFTYKSGTASAGGGIAVLYNAELNMSGGSVINNTSKCDGGGIAIGSSNTATLDNPRFTMTGGIISGNRSEATGGGIFVECTGKATISGGKITNNQVQAGVNTKRIAWYGGGGIYVNGGKGNYANGELQLYNVIVTDNSGTGLSACPTSRVEIYLTDGGAIYGNRGSNQLYFEYANKGGKWVISPYMLGGGAYNWTDENGNILSLNELQALQGAVGRDFSLRNAPSSESIGNAEGKGAVWITGNSSEVTGGGIATNGTVKIGTDTAKTSVNAKKDWKGDTSVYKALLKNVNIWLFRQKGGKTEYHGYQELKFDRNYGATRKEEDTFWSGSNEVTFSDLPEDGSMYFVLEEYILKDGTHVWSANGKDYKDVIDGIMKGASYSWSDEVMSGYKSEITGNQTDGYTITNTLAAGIDLVATKRIQKQDATLSESVPNKEAFQFTIKEADADGNPTSGHTETKSNDEKGEIHFSFQYTEEGTHYYVVSEVDDGAADGSGLTYDKTVYLVTVDVTKSADGALKAAKTIKVKKNGEGEWQPFTEDTMGTMPFVNTYDASGSISLTAIKTLEGAILTGDQFSFKLETLTDGDNALTETDASGATKTVTEKTVKNKADGSIDFGELHYTLEDAGKTYEYKVTEVEGDNTWITYDETVYTVTVGPIADNGDGSLKIPCEITDSNGNVLGSDATMTFINQYHASGDLTLEATKILNGATLAAEQFSFTLTATDADGNALTGENAYSETVTNAADGSITFTPFHYTQEDKDKDYYYTVTEAHGTDERVTYDGTIYRVTVHVTDNGDGTMTAAKTITANGEPADAITFANTYQSEANGSLALDATKILNGAALAAGQFSFTLTATDADGNALTGEDAYSETVVNAADGSVIFTPLAYTEEDDGKDYYYTVTEVRGTDAQVTYDGTVYRVAVHVTDNGDGTLTIEKTVTAGGQTVGDMTFTNTYTQQEDGRLTVVKQLTYNDTIYSAADATYYVALYADEALTQRVSDIMPLVYRNSGTASVEFTGLERGGTYYVGETTADGTVINSIGGVTADGTQYSPYFANGTRVVISEDGTSVFYFENVFLELPPEQFYPEGELTVTKQLTYAGEDYGAIDATYYVALFSDEALTDRVSEIMPLVYRNAGSTSVKFGGLEIGKTYYIGETTADGTVLNSIGGVTADGVEYSALFAGGNSAVVNEEGTAAVAFENEFEELPKDYYREGELTITKRLLGADGSAKNSSETFYAGIFADEAHTTFSDQVSQNIVPLNLGGKSFAEAKIKVAIAPGATQTLYVTEVDQNGKPVAGAASFRYDVTVENAVIQMDENVTEGAVTITNKETSPDDSETPETVTTTSVKTGDETPIVPYLIALAAAALALVILFVIRRRRRAK